MMYLCLAILSSAAISVLMRIGDPYIKNNMVMFAANYAVCGLRSFLFLIIDEGTRILSTAGFDGGTSFVFREKFSRRKVVGLGVVILSILLLGQNAWAAEGDTLTIAVASDLHMDPESPKVGTVNPLAPYNTAIVDALFYDVINQNADILLLCGDITNAGGEKAHKALIQKLQAAKKKGLQTYVLPGNHDLVEGEEEQFAVLYEEFGFADAYSRDTDSLSYSILLKGRAAELIPQENEATHQPPQEVDATANHLEEGEASEKLRQESAPPAPLRLLMLDTDGYTHRTNGAYLSKITLSWIEDQLKEATDSNQQVLVAGHYSLLTGQTTEFTGKDELIALLKKYQVPLYLCGHLHQRNVSSEDGLTELVVDQAISYPCSYALLQKESIPKEGTNTYRYTPRKIDVSAWAKETGQKSQELLKFNEYMETAFSERCEETIQLLKGDHYLSKRKTKQAVEFFSQVQQEYLQGTLPAHKEEIYKSSGYKAFMKIADGTTYGKWIPSFIEHASPYTAGFEI